MTETPGPDESGPYPDPRAAFMLTLAALLATGFVGVFFFGLGPMAAIGIGHAIAVGAIASLAARRIAEPQADRIGLRGFDLRAMPMILCLVPVVLLASELDNWATDMSPAKTEVSEGSEFETQEGGSAQEASAEIPPAVADDELNFEIDLTDPWTIAQAVVIYVGIAPVVEEFFFRGVLQQGIVARLGLLRGIGFTAMLYTVFHLPAVPVAARFFLGAVSAFAMGCTLGLARIATGSILASIILASAWAAIGIVSFALEDVLPLPGMNVDGSHLPWSVAIASVAVVAWALKALYREAERRYESQRFDP